MVHEPDEEDAAYKQLRQLTAAMREACFETAVAAYEAARMDGLCEQGAWECALEALRSTGCESVIAGTVPKV